MTFAAIPPDYNGNGNHGNHGNNGHGTRAYRTRSSIRTEDRSDIKRSRFANDQNQRYYDDPQERYWKNNHSVSEHEIWGTVVGQFPVIAPIGENVSVKNATFNALTERAEHNAGSWPDKTDFYMAQFEDIVPAAKLQANVAIENLNDIRSDVFLFADMEILDANLAVMPRGVNPNVDFSQNARDRTRYLRFTITVSPRAIVPGAMDFDPATFPSPTSTTACVRALMHNGTLAQGISKNLLDQTPKLVLFFYDHAHAEFDVSIKHRYDDAPDQEKYAKWLRDVKSKTKFYAGKHYIQQSYVGRLEGTETLAQRLTSVKQRTFDAKSQRPKYLSVQELHQSYQFLLVEIKDTTPPAEIPQLDQLLVQAVSEDLRKKLLIHLQPLPTTTNHANMQRFSTMVQHAIDAENELQTITNIADRAAHRNAKPHAARQNTNQRQPHTFFGGPPQAHHEEYAEEYSDPYGRSSATSHGTIPTCDYYAHSSGPLLMPTCFLAKHAPGISRDQQDIMAQAIIAMGTAAETLAEEVPFTGASIVEEALQQASGMRIPIKCFGCNGLPKYNENAFHLWRKCPNKGEKDHQHSGSSGASKRETTRGQTEYEPEATSYFLRRTPSSSSRRICRRILGSVRKKLGNFAWNNPDLRLLRPFLGTLIDADMLPSQACPWNLKRPTRYHGASYHSNGNGCRNSGGRSTLYRSKHRRGGIATSERNADPNQVLRL